MATDRWTGGWEPLLHVIQHDEDDDNDHQDGDLVGRVGSLSGREKRSHRLETTPFLINNSLTRELSRTDSAPLNMTYLFSY